MKKPKRKHQKKPKHKSRLSEFIANQHRLTRKMFVQMVQLKCSSDCAQVDLRELQKTVEGVRDQVEKFVTEVSLSRLIEDHGVKAIRCLHDSTVNVVVEGSTVSTYKLRPRDWFFVGRPKSDKDIAEYPELEKNLNIP